VIDEQTQLPIPFCNIKLKGTSVGLVTDFDGFFTLKCNSLNDVLIFSYLGYEPIVLNVKKVQLVRMKPTNAVLGVVEVHAGENPAHPIMRQVIAMRDSFNYMSTPFFSTESYTKIIVDIDNISERVRKWRALRPVTSLFDSIESSYYEDGKSHLPLFFTENISKLTYSGDKKAYKEQVNAARVSVIGVKDGRSLAQMTGAAFEDYNFYNPQMSLFDKEFLSPLSSSAFLFYEFYLIDTVAIEGDSCFRIKIKPKNNQDLAFQGYLYINSANHALQKVDVEVLKTANINFLEGIQIQQEVNMIGGKCFPTKTRVYVDFVDLNNKWVGFTAKFYISYKDLKVNVGEDTLNFSQQVKLDEMALMKDSSYWRNARHERLSEEDIVQYNLIDTVKQIPLIKYGFETLYTLGTGYFETQKIDIGPIFNFYRYNPVEGNRFTFGFTTNDKFSREWIFRTYLGYSEKDKPLKYNLQLAKILNRNQWTVVGIQQRYDIDQLGAGSPFGNSNTLGGGSTVYNAYAQISRQVTFNRKFENRLWLERELKRGVIARVNLNRTEYTPFYSSTLKEDTSNLFTNPFTTFETVVDLRWAPGETYIQNDNNRIRTGLTRKPVFTLNYGFSVKGILGSNMNYQKLNVGMEHRVRWGLWGTSTYFINAGRIFTPVPFSLIEVHRGNQTFLYYRNAYNLMNLFEFISDTYTSLDFTHNFNGLLFNRFPLIRKLKLREIANVKILYGDLVNNQRYALGLLSNNLRQRPYIEASAGIGNILTFFRVDAIWRMTYIDAPYINQYNQLLSDNNISSKNSIQKFGLKFSIQVRL
jgi:hypothetical protein